ncbi:MAG TPA: malectin domain-containing carbohydrate-binding protein, partial [Cyclobacteriaceae bacterium]|nr:malectin domain-containing carbohydrate-binding protein [Cyclobacteriaceae bacterium]
RGETFYGSIHINASGSQGRPITIGAYGSGDKPIITSLVSLNNWTSVGNGIYESHDPLLGSEVNIVLVNNAIQEMGRYPNSNSSNGGYLTIQSTNGHNNVVGSGVSGNWNGGEVVIRKSHWTIDRHKIVSQFGNIISFDGKGGSYSPAKGYGFFIQGHPNTLDREGEWYFNPSSKRLRMHFGSSQPNSKRIEVSTEDFLVTNSWNKDFIVFDNIHLKGANKKAFHIVRSNNFHIKNCDIEFSGENGMTIEDSRDFTFENSKLLYSNNNGVDLRGNTANAVIKNNRVENTGVFAGMGQSGVGNGIAILTGSDNNLIEYNEIKNTGYVGIRFGGNSTVVKNNLIESFCMTRDDGAAIYTWSGPSNIEYRGRKIIGNIILNGIGAPEGTPSNTHQVEGIYLDDNSAGVEITNNTVENVSGKGIFLHNARNVVIQNNTLFNNGVQLRLAHDRLGNPIRNVTMRENIFVAKTKDQLAASVSSIKKDIGEMGNFDNNSYARPFNDLLTFYAHNGNEKAENIDLNVWKSKFGKDQSSQASPISIPEYEVTHIDKNNKYANGAFNTRLATIQGIYGSNSKISWADGQLDGGTLQVEGRGNSSITKAVGSVKRSTYYVLKFTAKATKDAYVDLTIMKSIIPFTEVAPKVTLKISKGRGEYEAVFPVDASQPLASIRFAFNNQDLTYWLDNVGLYEAEAVPLDPDDYFKFEYNYSAKSKEIALGGTYIDVKNNTYSGKVSLAPYSSKVLIRTSKSTAPVEQPNQAPQIRIISPSQNEGFETGSDIEFIAEAEDKDGRVSKVEFYNGTALLGAATSTPFAFTWKNVALGEYTITAKATDDNSSSTISDPVKVKVKAPTSVGEEDSDGKPGGGNSSPPPPKEEEVTPGIPAGDFALYLNAGSHEDVRFEGKLYKGDDGFKDHFSQSSSKNINTAASGDLLYQTERHSERLDYSIPVPNGVYTVKTHHNELWFGKGGPVSKKGNRVFDVILEGKLVKDDLDLFVENGNKQVTLIFDRVEVKDGKLDLELASSSNRSTISGISIESLGKGADDDGPPVQEEPEESVEDPSPQPAFSLHLNAGTDKDYEYQGKTFKGDVNYKDYYNSSTSVNVNLAASSDAIFTTERHGEFLEYTIPVPNGIYIVTTYHNELWFGKGGPSSAKGRRVFDISLEGKLVQEDLDIFVESGNKELLLTFNEVEVKDGILNLEIASSQNRSTISAVSIESVTNFTDDKTPPFSLEPMDPVEDSPPSQTAYSLHLNAGSDKDYKYQGNIFKGDLKYSGYYNSTASTNVNLAASSDAIFTTERHDENLEYSIPVPNGTYTVITYHNELWFGKGGPSAIKGRRIFDIMLEEKLVKGGVDLFVENKNKQTKLTFEGIVVKDGELNLKLASSMNRATISALSIIRSGGKTGSPDDDEEKLKTKPIETSFSLFLNVGTDKSVQMGGNEYIGDNHRPDYFSNPTQVNTNPAASSEALYQSERHADRLSYSIPVPNGTYTVETFHNELWFGKGGSPEMKGRRVFDINIQGVLMKDDFDLFEEDNRPTKLTFEDIIVTEGSIDLELIASSNRATLSGIAIYTGNQPVGNANLRMLQVNGDEEKALEKASTSEEIKLYPNPAREHVTLSIDGEHHLQSILIHNMNGQLMRDLDPLLIKDSQGNYAISLSNIPQGVYLVSLVDREKIIERIRLLVKP